MAIKLTGVRSLQNKLSRMASDLSYDAERIMRERPELGEFVDSLQVAANRLEALAEQLTCTTLSA